MRDVTGQQVKGIALVVLTILTLGIFKSVYRRLMTPFRQVFLLVITTGYAFLLALAVFCAVSYELQIIGEHFEGMKPVLADVTFGYAVFAALFVAMFVTLGSTLSWYFNEKSMWERTRELGAGASTAVARLRALGPG
jgi:uncharacterized membrane protein YGL010W